MTTERCKYCAGSGIDPGCGDEKCCPAGECQSCDGTGERT